MEPCLTLSQFAANTNIYLDLNTTLIFQPGSHVMNSTLIVENTTTFSMVSQSVHTLSAVVICNETSNLHFDTVGNVFVSNLKFYKCRKIYLQLLISLISKTPVL